MEQVTIKKETGLELSKGIMSGKLSLTNQELSLTIKDTLSKPLIRSVFKGEDSGLGFTFMTAIVKRFVDSFGFSTKLTETQIETITVDALENFSYESVEDAILFFKMARSGKLGVTNKGLDSNLIFGEWLPVYLERKSMIREREVQNNQDKMSKETASIEDVKATYNKLSKRTDKKKIQAYIDRLTDKMDRRMLEDEISKWQRDEAKKPYLPLLKVKRKYIKWI